MGWKHVPTKPAIYWKPPIERQQNCLKSTNESLKVFEAFTHTNRLSFRPRSIWPPLSVGGQLRGQEELPILLPVHHVPLPAHHLHLHLQHRPRGHAWVSSCDCHLSLQIILMCACAPFTGSVDNGFLNTLKETPGTYPFKTLSALSSVQFLE